VSNIPHCSIPQEGGRLVIPAMAVHPLGPAISRRLGRLLLCQLPDLTRAAQQQYKFLLKSLLTELL
jgi:hypothetical protein